jgi:hypothetical protein
LNRRNAINLSGYIADLMRESEATARQPAAPKPDPLAAFDATAKPLVDRLRPLVASVPPEAAARGIPLEYFRTRLRGRYSRHALAGDVAAALRQLGWTRRRGWRASEEGFRARWFPPNGSERL